MSPRGVILDSAVAEDLTRRHARTFALASRFLPATKRRAAFAVYAFCRVADDIVDHAAAAGLSREQAQAALAAHRRHLEAALAGRPEGPVFREVAWAARQFGVPRDVLEELLDGVARDLKPVRFETWAELSGYCEGVAASVGAMCTWVFGVPGGEAVRERAVRYARTLGVAMQLTNILRDVGEDRRNGRCYLPGDTLRAFGLSAEEVLTSETLAADPRWPLLMQHEIARARALYEAAAPGIALLAPDAQRCARACAVGYEAILGAIEANGYDSLSVRARVGQWDRVKLLLSIWRHGTAEPAAAGTDLPVIRWGERLLERPEDMTSCA